MADALSAGASEIEHGSLVEAIPDDLFTLMRSKNASYNPTLTVAEAFIDLANGNVEEVERPLVQQVVPPALIQSTKQFVESAVGKEMRDRFKAYGIDLEQARRNLLRAYTLGVMLVTGSDSGSPLVFHGPTIHRELQLRVNAGIRTAAALQAATRNSASILPNRDRKRLVKPGYDADLLIVDGNPLKDIKQTENISQLILRGERIRRAGLFDHQ